MRALFSDTEVLVWLGFIGGALFSEHVGRHPYISVVTAILALSIVNGFAQKYKWEK